MRASTSASHACGSTPFDAAHRRQGYRRDKGRCFALSLALRIRGEIGKDEELPPGVTPACSLCDRTWSSTRFVQLAVTTIGIGLEDPGIVG
jgi:hypothetical protein